MARKRLPSHSVSVPRVYNQSLCGVPLIHCSGGKKYGANDPPRERQRCQGEIKEKCVFPQESGRHKHVRGWCFLILQNISAGLVLVNA